MGLSQSEMERNWFLILEGIAKPLFHFFFFFEQFYSY